MYYNVKMEWEQLPDDNIEQFLKAAKDAGFIWYYQLEEENKEDD